MGPGAAMGIAMLVAMAPFVIFWMIPQGIKDLRESRQRTPHKP